MSFTDRLYLETKESHRVVDKHPFVSLIRKNKLAGDMYVNFNKICINEFQNVLILKDKQLLNKLYRNIDIPDIYITKNLSTLLQHCRKYPLESAYQFYLGLLFGGNMLKKMLPNHNDFLTYNDSKQLIQEFKEYLNSNVTKQEQDIFVNNVNQAYVLIAKLFDEFYAKLTTYVPLDVQETGPIDGGPGTYPENDDWV